MTDHSNHLEKIEKLLAMNLANNLDNLDAIELLHEVGYNSKEIGTYIQMNPSTVRDKIAEMRDSGRIED